jgi:hypothetical protein
MKMKRLTLSNSPIALALLMLSVALHAQTPQYRLKPVELHDPSILTYEFRGMNDKEEIVGTLTRQIDNGFISRAFLWRDGELIELTEPTEHSVANDISDRSEVVGATSTRMFLWRHGHLRFPPTPDNGTMVPQAINERGQVVGLRIGGPSLPFLFSKGELTLLETPFSTFTGVVGINNLGEAVGDVLTAEIFGNAAIAEDGIFFRSALWRDGALTMLSMPSGTIASKALAINDHTQIVGDATFLDGTQVAVMWQAEQLTQLPFLTSADTWATSTSINNCGDAVGVSGGPIAGWGVLWRQGVALNVDDLIAPDDPSRPYVTIRGAGRITASGRILAGGFDSRDPPNKQRTYILRPVSRVHCHPKGSKGE